MEKTYYVYIITNRWRSTLYIGVTSDLQQRLYQHRTGAFDGFSKKYNLHVLVYYESTGNVHEAITREKQMKKWKRAWKEELIEKENPSWKDLSEGWFDS